MHHTNDHRRPHQVGDRGHRAGGVLEGIGQRRHQVGDRLRHEPPSQQLTDALVWLICGGFRSIYTHVPPILISQLTVRAVLGA